MFEKDSWPIQLKAQLIARLVEEKKWVWNGETGAHSAHSGTSTTELGYSSGLICNC